MSELAPWLNRIAIALAIWGLFLPSDAIMRLLMIVPALALGLGFVFRREISFEEEVNKDAAGDSANGNTSPLNTDARPNLNTMIFAPAGALGARACFDLQFVDWLWPVSAGTAAGIPLAALAVWSDPVMRTHVWSLVFIAVVMWLYAFGALAYANKFYDPTPGERFQTTVAGQRSKRPVRRTSLENHYVTVAPWGPITTPNEVRVNEDLYERLEAGGAVCVVLRPGRFGWPWYEAKAC